MQNDRITRFSIQQVSGPWLFAGFLIVHFCTQWLSDYFFFATETVVTVWPGSGLLLAVLLASRYRQWLFLSAAVLVSGAITDLIIYPGGLSFFLLSASAELVAGIVGAFLLRRFVASRLDMGSLRDVIALVVLGGLVPTALAAFFATPGVMVTHPESTYWATWLLWWYSSILGVLVFVPPIMAIRGISDWPYFTRRFWTIEFGLLFFALLAIGQSVLSATPTQTLSDSPYLIVPLLIWAALRFGPFIAALSTLIITLLAVVNAKLGLGPFVAHADSVYQQVLALQAYLGIVAIGISVFGAVVAQQYRDEQALLKATEARRTAMESIHERYWRYDKDLRLEVWSSGREGYAAASGQERVGQPLYEELLYWAERGWHGPGDPAEIAQERYQKYRDGSIPRFERHTTPDGYILEVRRYRTPDGGYTETQADVTGQIEREKLARENEALFKAFLAHSPSLIAFKDCEGRYSHVGDHFLDFHGLTVDQVIGHTPREIFSPEIAEKIESSDRYCLETGRIWRNEIWMETPTGPRLISLIRFPVKDTRGEMIANCSISIDITESRQQQANLRRSEDINRLTLEAVGSGGWDYNVATNKVRISDNLMQQLGYAPGEIEIDAAWFREHSHPDDFPKALDTYVDHVKGKSEFFECEVRTRLKSGEYKWMLVRGLAAERDEHGRVTRMVGANFDIDDRKHAEEALLQSEEKFRNLAEGSLQGFAVFDTSWKIEYINSALASILGYPDTQALVGNNWTQCIPEHELKRMQKYRDRRLQLDPKAPTQYETDLVRYDGSVIHVLIGVRLIEWNQHTAFQYIVFDITDQKKAELALRASNAQFNAFMDNTPDVIAIKNAQGEYIFVNRRYQQLYRVSKEQFQDQNELWNRIDVDPELAEQEERLVRETRKPRKYYLRSHIGDRDQHWFVTRFPILTAEGELVGTGLINTEITKLKRIELELAESEQRYRQLFETAPVSLWEQDWSGIKQLIDRLQEHGHENVIEYIRMHPQEIDREADVYKVIDVNAETLRLFGTRNKQNLIDSIQNRPWLECESGLLDRIEIFLDGQRRAIVESEADREDGSSIPVRITSEIVAEDTRDWSRVYTTYQDTTDEIISSKRLEEYRDELRSLAGRISLAEESERRRIASDLHDGTIQNLVVARMKILALRKSLRADRSKQLIDEITELLDSSLSETRTLIFDLSPPVLYELGLEAGIVWLTEQFKQRTGIKIDFKPGKTKIVLAHDLKVVLFQTVRELLVNIAKHAQADKVSIEWREHANCLDLRVTDNGIGFDSSAIGTKVSAEGGFGLFSIRERLNLVGTSFVIDSSNEGTRISIKAPLNNS